jgi:hypothetical protein
VTFPLNLLSSEEIVAELKRRKAAETRQLRDRVDDHKRAIQDLEAKLALLKNNSKTLKIF